MGIEDLVQSEETPEDGDLSQFEKGAYEALSLMSVREMAYHFRDATPSQKIIYQSFLELQTTDYRAEFDQAIRDPLLGEREEDDFADDAW